MYKYNYKLKSNSWTSSLSSTMAHLFRDLSSLGQSKRGTATATSAVTTTTTPPKTLTIPTKPISTISTDLPSPLGQLSSQLTDSDLRLTAYEIFVAACRTSTGKALSFTPSSPYSHSDSPTTQLSNNSTPNGSPALQRSLTSAAASKMKKALGLKSPGSGSKKSPGSSGSGSGSGPGKPRRAMTVGELMRVQMGISDAMDSRVRRALLRISAGQVSSSSMLFIYFIYLFIDYWLI